MPFAQYPGDRARAAIKDAQPRPLWLDSPDRPAARESLTGHHSAGLVVVGAGLSGLWTALRAKQRHPNADVVLIEGDRIGNAASGRNGGFVASSITHGYPNGIDRWPEEFSELHRLGVANLEGIEKTIADFGIDCGYRRTGELDVATEEYQVVELAEYAEQAQANGVDVELFDAETTRGLVNSPTYLASVLDPYVGIVDPARLCWGLADAAASLGVRIYEHSAVTSIKRQQGRVQVSTLSGSVNADKVALTTAAHTPLLKRISQFVVPVFDHVVATAPIPDEVLADIGWTGRQGVGDAGNQFHYYRLTDDNRLLWGGYDAVYARGERPGSSLEHDDFLTARLVQHMHDTFPQLVDVPVEYTWAGAIDTCSRFTAFWGTAHGGRVAYVAGWTGLGVGASRFGADVLLDLLAGADTERTRLRMVRGKPLPFPPEPMRQWVIDLTRNSLARADERGGERDLWLRTLDRLGLGFDS